MNNNIIINEHAWYGTGGFKRGILMGTIDILSNVIPLIRLFGIFIKVKEIKPQRSLDYERNEAHLKNIAKILELD